MADLPSANVDLERRLRGLAAHVAFPPTPALSRSVIHAIEASPAKPATRFPAIRPRPAFAIVAALVLLAVAISAIPAARHAVARWIDLPGIHLSWLDGDPPANLETEIRLGTRVALSEAIDEAGFVISLPTDERANEPDEIFSNSYPASGPSFPPGVVSFVYLADDDLPAVSGTKVGLLITQFQGDSSSVWANKSLMMESKVVTTYVDGENALWLPDTHLISIQPESAGDIQTPSTRATGSVLIWNRSGVTYRIEGNLPYEAMLAIAESMEPIEP